MKRTLDAVPKVVDLETNGEVWASLPINSTMRLAILTLAVREHQSIETATERLVNRALREAIARHRRAS